MIPSLLSTLYKELCFFLALPVMRDRNKPIINPSIVQFSLTNQCNSKCSMCNFWKEKKNPKELSFGEIKQILNELKSFGIQKISYTANGELLTRKDIMDILQYTRSLNIDFAINTNGLLIINAFAKQLGALKPYNVIIGLDTMDDTLYQKIRGIKDGVKQVKKAIERLKSNGVQTITIGAVITKDNIDHLLDIAEYVKKENLSGLRFTALQFRGFDKKWSQDGMNDYTSDIFLYKLKEQIKKLLAFQKKYGVITNLPPYLEQLPDYYRDHRNFHPLFCVTGFYILKIQPQGEISLCPLCGNSAIIGNIRKDRIENAWHSEKARKIRKNISQKKCVHCWLSCHAEANIRFTPRYFFPGNFQVMNRYIKAISQKGNVLDKKLT